MGKFIEVELIRSINGKRKMINVSEIVYVTPDSTNRAYITMRNEEEFVTNHTYDEIRNALFMLGENQPVYEVTIGELKDEK